MDVFNFVLRLYVFSLVGNVFDGILRTSIHSADNIPSSVRSAVDVIAIVPTYSTTAVPTEYNMYLQSYMYLHTIVHMLYISTYNTVYCSAVSRSCPCIAL